jgi:hypothetical protein
MPAKLNFFQTPASGLGSRVSKASRSRIHEPTMSFLGIIFRVLRLSDITNQFQTYFATFADIPEKAGTSMKN